MFNKKNIVVCNDVLILMSWSQYSFVKTMSGSSLNVVKCYVELQIENQFQ